MTREIHLGLFMLGTGNHFGGWRHPGATDTFLRLEVSQEIAQTAERGKFDLLFLGDGFSATPGTHPSYTVRLDPMALLSALAVTTKHIGLGATTSTTYTPPFTIARSFASLDHISSGRAAWNVVTTANSDAGGNFGRAHPNHDLRYEIAAEAIDIVKGLWDCWEDDAIVANRETGLYIDWNKVHALNHEGKHFSVRGPLNIGRSPQGHTIIIQAGGSDSGQELAARTADVVFSAVQDFDEAKAAYRSFKERVGRNGRDPESVCLMPGVMPIIGQTDADARAQLNLLQSYLRDEAGIGMLSGRLGVDLKGVPLDQPVPDLQLPDGGHGIARAMLSKAHRENLTLRDLYNLVTAARGHWVLCGTPHSIADTLEQWFIERAADGFNIMPPYFHGAFNDFVDLVVPELQRRGLYRVDYRGSTLRDHLGLSRVPRPARAE